MSGVIDDGAYYQLNAGDKVDLYGTYTTISVRNGTVAYLQVDRNGEKNVGVVEEGHFGKLVDTPVVIVALEPSNVSVNAKDDS